MWTTASPSEIRSYYLRSLLPNSKQNLRMRVKMYFLGGRWSGTHSTTSFSFTFLPPPHPLPLVGRMKRKTEAVTSLSFITLPLTNQCLADPSLDPNPDGWSDLLPIGRLIEQLYHKSLDSAVWLMLNWTGVIHEVMAMSVCVLEAQETVRLSSLWKNAGDVEQGIS